MASSTLTDDEQSLLSKGLSGDALTQHMQDAVDGAVSSQPLPTGSITGDIQRFLTKHPAGRLFLPFIKVPYNLLNSGALERTLGLNMIREGFRKDLSGANGTDAQALAHGKMMTGATLVGGAALMAASGTLTGSGPANPDARRQLLQSGWQP
jgi:hypothetical protein